MNASRPALSQWWLLSGGLALFAFGCTGASSVPSPCEGQACSDHGRCAVFTDQTAVCVCAAGYHAANALTCEPNVAGDECAGVDCSAGGVCAVSGSDPVCVCGPGYHPAGATTCLADVDPCAGQTCSGHGTCAVAQGAALCVCEAGYAEASATTCIAVVDSCTGVTCSGHGRCVIDQGAATCLCDERAGWYPLGADCVNPCAGVTCSGHGTCEVLDGLPLCACTPNYVEASAVTCSATSPGRALALTNPVSIARTRDGGYILASYSSTSFALTKVSAGLAIEWTRTFPSGTFDDSSGAQEAADGGYVLLGRKYSPSMLRLIRTDANGTLQWEKLYSKTDLGMTAPQGIVAASIEVTPDHGYVMPVGSRKLVKVNDQGVLQWSRDVAVNTAPQALNAPGGGFIVVGGEVNPDSGSIDMALVKTDDQGVEQWKHYYGSPYASDLPSAVAVNPAGGYVAVGQSDGRLGTEGDFSVVKVDAVGAIVWERVVGGLSPDRALAVQVSAAGRVVVGGALGYDRFNHTTAFLTAFDSFGTREWQGNFADLAGDLWSCNSLVLTGGNEALCFGEDRAPPGANSWLLRVDSNGVAVP